MARHKEAEVRLASELFEKATQADPNYASAFAMYAQCHMFLGFYGFVSPQEGFEKALPSLRRAIKIDRDLDIGHMLLGRLLMDREWDWEGAGVEFRRAIIINPNSAEPHYRYALLLTNLKRDAEALTEARIAEELEPLSVAANQIAGTIMLNAGKYHDAVIRFERALEMDPETAFARNNLGLAKFETGKLDEGIADVRKAIKMDPNNIMFKVDLIYLLCKSGKEKEARKLLIDAEKQLGSEDVSSISLAGMYSCLRENEKAMKWLEKAYMEHSPYLASLGIEKWFESIREHSEFVALLRKLGLKD